MEPFVSRGTRTNLARHLKIPSLVEGHTGHLTPYSLFIAMRRGAGGRARPRGGDTRGRGPTPGCRVGRFHRKYDAFCATHTIMHSFARGVRISPRFWHGIALKNADRPDHSHTHPARAAARLSYGSRTALAACPLAALSPRRAPSRRAPSRAPSRRAARPHTALPALGPLAAPRAARPAASRLSPCALSPRRATPGTARPR